MATNGSTKSCGPKMLQLEVLGKITWNSQKKGAAAIAASGSLESWKRHFQPFHAYVRCPYLEGLPYPQVAGYSIFLQGLDAVSQCLLELVVGSRVFWCLLSLGVFGNEANIRAVWTPPLSLG